MDIKAFSFNSQEKYRTGGHFKEKTVLTLVNQEIMVDSHGDYFKAMFPDIFADYQKPPLTGDVAMANKAWQIWQNTPFGWWQCQLNFDLWCASAGCGVSFEDHLQLSSGMGDPHGVDWLIINRRQGAIIFFCALTCAVGYAGEVLQLDVIKVAREGFIRLLECFHSGATQTFPVSPSDLSSAFVSPTPYLEASVDNARNRTPPLVVLIEIFLSPGFQ